MSFASIGRFKVNQSAPTGEGSEDSKEVKPEVQEFIRQLENGKELAWSVTNM